MSGSRMKKLRKKIFGEMSFRDPRKYAGAEHKDGILTMRNVGLRDLYQKIKKRRRNHGSE